MNNLFARKGRVLICTYQSNKNTASNEQHNERPIVHPWLVRNFSPEYAEGVVESGHAFQSQKSTLLLP